MIDAMPNENLERSSSWAINYRQQMYYHRCESDSDMPCVPCNIILGLYILCSKHRKRWIPESAENLEFSAERLSENAKTMKTTLR